MLFFVLSLKLVLIDAQHFWEVLILVPYCLLNYWLTEEFRSIAVYSLYMVKIEGLSPRCQPIKRADICGRRCCPLVLRSQHIHKKLAMVKCFIVFIYYRSILLDSLIFFKGNAFMKSREWSVPFYIRWVISWWVLLSTIMSYHIN